MISKNILDLKPYAPFASDAKIRLDANENPYSLPKDLIHKIFNEAKSLNINRYPDHEAKELKKKITDIYGAPENLIVAGNGSDELISSLIIASSGSPKRVIYPVPTFSMYGIIAKTIGAEVLEIPLNHDFTFPAETFLRAVEDENPSIIFISYPNNPTGNAFDEKILERIMKTAKCLVVIDEAYQDFSSKKSFLPRVLEFENLVVLSTLSKIGMAGLRIGFAVSCPAVTKQLDKVRLPYNLNSISQFIATKVLENYDAVKNQIEKIKEGREFLEAELSKIQGMKIFPSDANFLLIRHEKALELFNHLLENGILVRFFQGNDSLKNCLRITVGTNEENEELIKGLVGFLNI